MDVENADFVELIGLDPTIQLDIRYARADNFVGRPVYPAARAFLQRPAAEALVRVHRYLSNAGLGLVVFDGYRPWSVTKVFWDVTPVEHRIFVANPERGSRHNRGCAVDLSLYDRRTGRPLPMTSEFDEFSERAYADYAGGTTEERENRDRLRRVMETEGFSVYRYEWWHFDHESFGRYPLFDLSFEDIDAGRTTPRETA